MIGDDIAEVLPELRSEAESLMVDTAMITRPGGEPTFDPSTGELTPAAGTTIYEGPCRLRQPTASEAELLFGDEQLTRSRFVACFPHDVTGVQIGDVVTVTESDDPDVLLRSFRVASIPLATFTLYKGFPVEVVE